MLNDEVKSFFKKYPPFSFLDEPDLELLFEDVSLEYYPKGYMILTQNGPPTEYLRIVKKGAVKVYIQSDESEEILIDYRSEGELFGFISLISSDRSRANVLAVEDTICYLVPKQRVISIIETNPSLNEYFLKSFFINFIDKTYEETRKRFSLIGEGDRVLFTTSVGDIVRREPVAVPRDTPIRRAARLMSDEQISSLIITDGSGVPVGIITDRDLRTKVVARERDIDEPVHTIMSPHLIRVDADEFCFEALLRMIRYNIHHILVVDNGSLKGLVSNHDFMLLQGQSPTALVNEIERLHDISTIPQVFVKMNTVVSNLLRDGARAYNLTGLISEVLDKVVNKIVDHIEKSIGPSPLHYSLFIFGDGGRRELTLNPHIKLGIIHEDTNNLTLMKTTRQYFREFIDILTKHLGAISKPGASCPDERLVISEEAVRSLSEWISIFRKYSSAPFQYHPDIDLLDMRSIRGEGSLLKELNDQIRKVVGESEEYMDYVATKTVENRPPLGFFRKLVVEKSGEHKNELDIYTKGILPIVSSIRIFSLEKGIIETSTLKRERALTKKHAFEEGEDLLRAFDYLLMLLIYNQIEQIEKGIEPDDFINPEGFGYLERKTLKEAFNLIVNIYDVIEKGYRTERAP